MRWGAAILAVLTVFCPGLAPVQAEESVSRLPWHDERSRLQSPPDRQLDILEYRIAVDLDFDRQEVRGEVSVRGRAFAVPVSSVQLHAADMEILAVRGPDGEAIAFRRQGDELRLELPRPLAPGESTSFSIRYVARPTKGLYFVGPTDAYPDTPVQAWTQGEPLDTRYWLPVFDAPAERATTVVSVTVPERFTAISNGELRSVEDGPSSGKRTFIWSLDFPHVNYLISLAVGEFEELRQEWDGIPIRHYVPPGRGDEGMRLFGRTPEMMAFFSDYIGVRYPYSKYAQVTVHDFIHGGMENISATTQTVETLHEERNHLDFPSDSLVAHELAHQWWGDYVTCSTWAHAWLNEGFATYFDALFTEHEAGRDEFDLRMRKNRERYLTEDACRRRPLVLQRYAAPMDLFDAVLYQKGAWVLHMIRAELGEAEFRAAIRRHAARNGGRSVESTDFRIAIAEATGRDLTRFFGQWVYGAGHPELYARHAWQAEDRQLRLTIRQTTGGAEAFHLPLTVEIVDQGGSRRHRIDVHALEQEVLLPAVDEPLLVLIDPDENLLKVLEHDKGIDEWLRQLATAERAIQRLDAAEALSDETSANVVERLSQSLMDDPFHGVRAGAARALGAIGGDKARDLLLARVTTSDSRVRAAVFDALGEIGDEAAVERLRAAVAREPADAPLAAALKALSRCAGKDAWPDLRAALGRESHRDVVRAAALEGLVRVNTDVALDALLEWTEWGRPQRARSAAVKALGRWDGNETRVRERLIELTRDEWLFVRREAARSLGRVGGEGAEAALRRVAEHDAHARVRLAARRAVQKLESGVDNDDAQTDLDGLRRENERLRDALRAVTTGRGSGDDTD